MAEEPDLCPLSDHESHIILSWDGTPGLLGEKLSADRLAQGKEVLQTETPAHSLRWCRPRPFHIRPEDRTGRRNFVCPFYRVPQRSSCHGVFREMQAFFVVVMLLLKHMD